MYKEAIRNNYRVRRLIWSYQERGHLAADLDPLGIWRQPHAAQYLPPPILFSHDQLPDPENVFTLPSTCFIGGSRKSLSLREIIRRLNNAYCRTIGVDLGMNMKANAVKWIRERFEKPDSFKSFVSKMARQEALWRLARANLFEGFLARKWPSEKRFGLEGCESLIPGLLAMLDVSAQLDASICNIAMAHRGRLNVLANVLKTPLDKLLAQFQSVNIDNSGTGDVKYHLGHSVSSLMQDSKPFVVSLVANPSHLEAAAPVAIGKTKAQQFFLQDNIGNKVLPVIIHGDAAASGQGIVFETFLLSNCPGYDTNGSVHIIINNQIGFTTNPVDSRSTEYSSDVGKMVGAPVFHVNADDVDAVLYTFTLAAKFRFEFRSDVIIDLIGYRRNGHNEADDPTLTQPHMYQRIQQTPDVFKKYCRKLIQDQIVIQEQIDKEVQKYEAYVDNEFQESTKITYLNLDDWIDSPWPGYFKNKDMTAQVETGVNKLWLEGIGMRMTQQPTIAIHQDLIKSVRKKNDLVSENKLDWSIIELITFASLLVEGIHVRLSGQEVESGMSAHRTHVYHGLRDNQVYCPLDFVGGAQSVYKICNSPMSDYAVAGFEMGYSIVSPHQLVIWECMYGDRGNSAQIIIDQFLVSGERKWRRQSGIVFMLPHGLDGQGPEYSTARPERFLQMSDDDEDEIDLSKGMMEQLRDCNFIMANLTLPANLFHLLRRQVKTVFRKPLIILSPKDVVMTHPEFVSKFEDLDVGTKFKCYVPDPDTKPSPDVVRFLLCTGKVYFDLKQERKKRQLERKVAIARVEQISPFPYREFLEDYKRYENAKFFWAQEEPKNQGFWDYLMPRIAQVLKLNIMDLGYVGRASSPTPAANDIRIHLEEQARFMDDAFNIPTS